MSKGPLDDDIFLAVLQGVPILLIDNRGESRHYLVGQPMMDLIDELDNDSNAILWHVEVDYPPIKWDISYKGASFDGTPGTRRAIYPLSCT
jgi:hypothetical protein